MKYQKIIFTSIMTIILVLSVSPCSLAVNTEFTTEPMNQEKQQYILSLMQFEYFTEEPAKRPFSYFDVNQSEQILIGFDTSSKKTACVYSSEGDFKYGYRFFDDGSVRFQWDGDHILVYSVRGNIISSLDPNGNCIEMQKIQDTVDNHMYWNHLSVESKEINNSVYTAGNGRGKIFNILLSVSNISVFSSNTYVTKTLQNGSEIKIYEAIPTLNRFISVYLPFGISGALIVFVIAVIFLIRKVN